MYGIAFGLKLLNQGGALVHVYKDGSVLLTHGGIEIGQVHAIDLEGGGAQCLYAPPTHIRVSIRR